MKACTTILQLLCIASVITSSICQTTLANCDVTPDPNLDGETDPDQVYGNVTFSQEGEGAVTVTVELEGFDTTDTDLLHGFHIHETGDISGGCVSAGGHYNPEDVGHGLPTESVRHVGDLGNVGEDEFGDVSTSFTDDGISLVGEQSIIGRAVVVHANEDIGSAGDDAGSAGTRLACCVIY